MGVTRLVRLGDQTRTVTPLAAGGIDVDGRTWSVEPAGPGAWRLSSDDTATRVWVAGPPDAPWVFWNGRVYRPEVSDGDTAPRASREEVGTLTAPMPATVRAILVQQGDTVKTGQTLVVLEAMKMELPLRAPRPGTVVRVSCAVGDLVQPGAPLVELA